MISRIHNKLGTAGLVVAIVALVAALSGAAFAAGGLTGQEKKEVKKIAKKFAGKDGKTGAQGPAGPQGPKGDTGSEGKQGIQGEPGKDGEDGACSEANPDCTVPAGATETGVWSLGNTDGPTIYPLTFNLPLNEAPTEIHYVNEEGEEQTGFEAPHTPTNCLGSVANPEAPEGEVCIYADEESLGSGFPGFVPEAFQHFYRSGVTFFYSLQSEEDRAWGTWAVTGN